MTRPRVARLAPRAAVALAVVTLAGTFLSWGRSGDRRRTSYELVDAADRAGVVPDSLAGAAVLWLLVPALCGIVLVAASVRRFLLVGSMATTLGAIVITGGVLVIRSPLGIEPGALAAMLGGAGTMAAGITTLITNEQRRNP